MTVKEMCAEYGLVFQTVYKKIERHKNKELAGHIIKVKGNSVELDDYAVDFLLPQSVKTRETQNIIAEVMKQNHELNFMLTDNDKIIESLNEELKECKTSLEFVKKDRDEKLNIANDLYEKNKELTSEIEQKNKETEQLNNQLANCRKQAENLTADISQRDKKIETLTAENAELKSRKGIFRK